MCYPSHHPKAYGVRKWLVPAHEWLAGGFPQIDLQMHTQWTDGQSSVGQMIDAARSAGLQAIALTEHYNTTSAWYREFVEEVKALREPLELPEVYYGVEVAAVDYGGGLKADVAKLDAELVLGVVHRYPREGGGFWNFGELTAEQAVDLEMRILMGLACNPQIDVLGHPGGAAFRKFGPFPVERLEPVMRAAKARGVAFEVNTKYLWDLDGLLALLERVDPFVSFGSDAHSADQVGANSRLLQAHQCIMKGAQ